MSSVLEGGGVCLAESAAIVAQSKTGDDIIEVNATDSGLERPKLALMFEKNCSCAH